MGSHCNQLRGDRTCRSDRPDARHQRPITRLLPRVTKRLTSATNLQRLSSNACAVKSRPDAPVTRPDVPISSRASVRHDQDTSRRTLAWSPLTSSKHPKKQNRDRTHQVTHDQTRSRVRSSLANSCALRQRTSAGTGLIAVASGRVPPLGFGHRPEAMPLCPDDRTRRSSVRSLEIEFPRLHTSPNFTSLD